MQILTIAVVILFFAILVLAFVYWQMSVKSKREKETKESSNGSKSGGTSATSTQSGYTKLSVFDFMEFDKIEDNMIVQNNGARYLMAIECEGINYDLMSEIEKVSVE